MSMPRLGAIAIALFIGVTLNAAPGQVPNKSPDRNAAPAAPATRLVYAVRGKAAEELAKALTLHFQGESGFRVVPVPAGNTLLLSGPKAALEAAVAVLRDIDRPARSVHVEVYCLELSGKAGGEASENARPPEAAELRGSTREFRAKLREWQQKGIVSSIKTVELTALTGQNARTQVSANKPFVTGVSVAGGGFRSGRGPGGGAGTGGGNFGGARGGGRGFGTAPGGNEGPSGFGAGPGSGITTRSITYRTVGMSVQVKPEVGVDGRVTLDLHIEDSNTPAAGTGMFGGADDQGTGTSAPEFSVFNLESRVSVPSGQVVLAESTKSQARTSRSQVIVIVGANIE